MSAILSRVPDAKEFCRKSGLCRKAGVSENQLLAVVVKELVDNALDAAEQAGADVKSVSIGLLPERNGFFVEDGAGGFSNDALLEFWRVDRGYTSSKRFRLPTRGALGNGLRVVAGAVVAFDAELTVHTRGKAYSVQPRPEGEPLILETGDSSIAGTRIEMAFPQSVAVDESALAWGNNALLFSSGDRYTGKTSPHWYSPQSLHELFEDLSCTVAAAVGQFAGCSGEAAGLIAEGYQRIAANEITLNDAAVLLERMKARSLPVKGMPGFKKPWKNSGGFFEYEGCMIPFTVSALAYPSDSPGLVFAVNRSRSLSPARLRRKNANELDLIFPANERYIYSKEISSQSDMQVLLNLNSPVNILVSDGKAVNTYPIWGTGLIQDVVQAAVNAAKRKAPSVKKPHVSKWKYFLAAIPAAVEHAGGGGNFRCSQRQVFYSMRPGFLEEFGEEPDFDYFAKALTEFENINGDIPNLTRDNRGTLVIPHTREKIPVGTVSVDEFKRPRWTFNRVVYIEKEGLFDILLSAKWAEKWDAALLTSKGFASRAAKDLIDLLGDDGEPVEFFCVHDADASGTMIYQSLQEATASRGARRVEIINLGLEPSEGVEMGLPSEPVDRKKGKKREERDGVARYVPEEWREWLQTGRIELNAMTAPELIDWLDAKMEAATNTAPKLIPPERVLGEAYEKKLYSLLTESISSDILEKAGLPALVRSAVSDALDRSPLEELRNIVSISLEQDRGQSWSNPIDLLAFENAFGEDS